MTQEIEDSKSKESIILKIGSKVRIDKPTHKGWFWKYGWAAEIRDNEALINYGTQTNTIYGMGIWVKISELKIMKV